jgi:CRISPR system Cascade subunit CasE
MHFSRMTLVEPAKADSAARTHHTYGHHQLVWSFYADDPEAERDFLYRFDLRREGPCFLTVSTRPPSAAVPGWRIETRAYEPLLEKGADLRFSLRANPTKRVAEPGKRSDGKRHDVVMIAKRALSEKGEAVDMATLVQEEGTRWLARQGEQHGFRIDPANVRADNYRSHRFRRPRDGQEMSITGIDYEGLLTVTEPEAFARALRSGIGHAKGFGFGLLLVRRP